MAKYNGKKVLSVVKTGYLDLNLVYPVGSIYLSVNNTNPSSLFGGTWEQIKDRFLLGSGDTYNNGETGGQATHTPSGSITIDGHKLTINEIPSHNHGFRDYYTLEPYSVGSDRKAVSWDVGAATSSTNATTKDRGGSQSHNHTGSFNGTEQNTMPPYLVVYMWKRTA